MKMINHLKLLIIFTSAKLCIISSQDNTHFWWFFKNTHFWWCQKKDFKSWFKPLYQNI